MIDVYFWTTPNGYKVTILLEELGWKYNVVPVNIGKGEQFKPEFLKISPNNRMPAIVDHEGPGGTPISVFESGAILMYLAEKASWKFFPQDMRRRYDVVQWLMFQMASVGPMFGQANHFRNYAPEKIQYAIERYANEERRICNVIDKRISEVPYLAGEYSIADMATYPWLRGRKQVMEEFPHLTRWYKSIDERPAVQRGLAVMKAEAERARSAPPDPERWEILFGKKQFEKR
jgi:GSH-dependent disulfide-bond oxidoreductase